MSNKYQKVKDSEKKADIITDKDETDLDKNQRNISKSKEEINQNKNIENLE